MNNQERISRSEFLKRSSLGLCALFVGLNEKVFAGSAPAKALSEPGEHLYNWGQAWHPESPKRLSDITHHLAQMGLSGQHGRNMPTVDWEFPEGRDEKLSNNRKYGYAALSVARNAPLRILPGELIVGSATLREAAQHRIPALNMGSVSHTTVGFAKVLHQGYKGLRAEIDERLSRGGLDSHGTDLLESMLMTLDAAALWQQRNIALLKEMKGNAPDSERRFYQNIIDTLENVPENPPRNFREAVQSLWSLYAFHRLMGNWSGIGRFDQMLWPYLEADLQKGKITLDEARELIAHFWIKGTEWIGEFNGSGDAQFYQNIILGGIDKDGNEVTNPITYLVLDVVEELHISDYPIAVRIGDHTPEKLFRRIAEVQRFGGGIVSMYNENTVIDGLVQFGYPLEEAREFTNDGCWEAIIPGKTAFIYSPCDMMQPLFRALNLDKDVPLEADDFETVYGRFTAELGREIDNLQKALDGSWNDPNNPNPLVSMFVEGCIEKGRGYYERGPKYTVNGIHYGGVSDTANSLLVLKKLVFEENYIGLNHFVNILRHNWEGNEGLRRLVQNRFTFYGNDHAEADDMMKRVFDDYTSIVGRVKERNGLKRPCGISTFGREIDWRMARRATPEGSRVGDILATNCSPTPGSDRKGPTAVLNSYCKLERRYGRTESPARFGQGRERDRRAGRAGQDVPREGRFLHAHRRSRFGDADRRADASGEVPEPAGARSRMVGPFHDALQRVAGHGHPADAADRVTGDVCERRLKTVCC